MVQGDEDHTALMVGTCLPASILVAFKANDQVLAFAFLMHEALS